MANTTISVTANGTYKLGSVIRNRNYPSWIATLYVSGTFGGGTLAWQWSPDGGTTIFAMNDQSRAAITSTAIDSFRAEGETGDKNTDKTLLYVTLSGATSPSLIIGFLDSN